VNSEQFQKIKTAQGFIAALDQSGGSTPKALRLYGVDESAYSNDAEMYDRIHEMRTRIITSPAFTGERILGSILFEMTMDRQIMGRGAAEYLWQEKNVVPFLKVDKGLADEADGAQVMKPMPDLDAVLARALSHGVFGTKMRSVIKLGNEAGVGAVVHQQFEVGRHIIGAGLVPIIEPEIDIHSPEKAAAEVLLKAQTDPAGAGQLLRRARGEPQRPAGGRAVRRVHPSGGQRAAGPQPRCGRQLLARADGRPDRPAERG
jgi:fructose-bisphosphate aldolase class I